MVAYEKITTITAIVSITQRATIGPVSLVQYGNFRVPKIYQKDACFPKKQKHDVTNQKFELHNPQTSCFGGTCFRIVIIS